MTRRELAWAALAAALGGRDGDDRHESVVLDAVDRWRRDFPALEQRIDGHRLIYLDSAATTQRPNAMIDAMADYYRRDNANPGAALHALARRAHGRLEDARSVLARFLHATTPQEIVWVRGTTEGVNLVANAWARPRLRADDEILLSVAEHASNLLPWQRVAGQTGASVRYVDVDDAGRLSLTDLERKLTRRTRLLAFSHVSNVAGFVNPAGEICALARRAGARVFIDAAQSAPHIALDVATLGCDFLAFSGHKMLGPMGVGVLWARAGMLDEMEPWQAGSNMAHDVDLHSHELETGARRFGAGTPHVTGPVGLAAAVRYLDGLGRNAIEEHEADLTGYALDRLAAIPGLRMLGPMTARDRIPVFSFALPRREPRAVLSALDARGIAVRAGDLSALPLLKRFGVTSAVRASCYLYTCRDEIDALADALAEIVKDAAQMAVPDRPARA
jgi:cysteine desulfurase / selenocysteine lyase